MKKKYVNQQAVLEYVHAVEEKKKYRRDAGLVVRHLFEEAAECSRKVWLYEKLKRQLRDATMNEGGRPSQASMARYISMQREIAKEVVDVVCVALLLSDIVGVEFNDVFEERMAEVFKKYRVPQLKRRGAGK